MSPVDVVRLVAVALGGVGVLYAVFGTALRARTNAHHEDINPAFIGLIMVFVAAVLLLLTAAEA
jgi:hypothetical protein